MSDMEYAILSKAFDWSVNSSNFKIDLIGEFCHTLMFDWVQSVTILSKCVH